jgi:hypothetical protein
MQARCQAILPARMAKLRRKFSLVWCHGGFGAMLGEMTPEELREYARQFASKGGHARAASLSPEARQEIATRAASAAMEARAACQHPDTFTRRRKRQGIDYRYCVSCRRKLGPA